MDQIEVLLPHKVMPMIERGLADAFVVHRLHDMPDRDAFLAEHGRAVTAMATGPMRPIGPDLLRHLPNLKIIANFGVGYDGIDTAYCAEHGIVVTNTPDVLTDEVADTAMALLLMTARELGAAERYLRAGKWSDAPYPLTRATLRGRTLGIAGLGRIGQAIARRAEAFGLKIAYFGRSRKPDQPYSYYDDLVAMARDVDTLLSALPGDATTERIIGRDVFAALGSDGIFVNIGRGSSVDEDALIEALESGTIWSAGLDVFANEPNVPDRLIALDRVVLLPHVASASVRTREDMGQLVIDNLVAWRDTGRPLSPVAETPVPAIANADLI